MYKSGLKAAPLWTPTFTENELDSSPSTKTAALQPYRDITPLTKYSGIHFYLKAKQITSLGTRSKAFSRSTKIKKTNSYFWL